MANSILNMHYDFKMKLNKLDSQKYANLLVPEIDWKLNEAQMVLIKMIAFPRLFKGSGFEIGRRTIDDLRPIVKNNFEILGVFDTTESYSFALPPDYLHHLSSYITAKKFQCTVKIRTHEIQHDDKANDNPFDKSNFEWREVNIKFTEKGIIGYTDGSFSLLKMHLDYLRKPKYMHGAGAFHNGEYKLPDGTLLSGFQNCELPESVHSDIVDLAVLITTGDLLTDNYQVKQVKTQMT